MFQPPVEIHISFGENSIVVQAEHHTERFSNWIAIDQETAKIVDIGKTEAEVSMINPEKWKTYKDLVVFEPIYDSKNFNPENMYWVVTAWARDFEYKLRGFRMHSHAVCYARIPGYETFPSEAREYFEYWVQSAMRFRRFLINGNETQFTRGKLNLAEASLGWGRWISLALVLFLLARTADGWSAGLESLNGIFCFVFPILIILAVVIPIWAIDILWLVGMQRVLPKKYVRQIFEQLDSMGGSVSKFLPDLLLKKENRNVHKSPD